MVAGVVPAFAEPNDITRELEQIEEKKENSQKKLRKLQAETKKANKMLSDIDKELSDMARYSAKLERNTFATEARMNSLTRRQDALNSQFQKNSESLEDFLSALLLWQGRRPPLLLSKVHETHDAIRAAILMSETAPKLEGQAQELKTALNQFSAVRNEIESIRKQLQDADKKLKIRRKHVANLARRKRDLLERLGLETQQIHKENLRLAGKAKNLRELVDKLVSHAPSAPIRRPTPPIFSSPDKKSSEKQQLQTKNQPSSNRNPTRPTQGKILYAFGQHNNAGEKQLGLTYITRQDAQITAPLDGIVEFAESFRTYGHIVILNVGNGYRLVLAGMEKVLVREGQNVFIGEPLGHMSSAYSAPEPHLYFEVRHNDKPVDPNRWMKQKS